MPADLSANERRMLVLITKVLANQDVLIPAERLILGQMTLSDRITAIDAVVKELLEKGFGADSEPSAYGLELEGLIDYLNRANLA